MNPFPATELLGSTGVSRGMHSATVKSAPWREVRVELHNERPQNVGELVLEEWELTRDRRQPAGLVCVRARAVFSCWLDCAAGREGTGVWCAARAWLTVFAI